MTNMAGLSTTNMVGLITTNMLGLITTNMLGLITTNMAVTALVTQAQSNESNLRSMKNI